MKDELLKSTWQKYLESKKNGKIDQVAHNKLIEHYFYLVKKTAGNLHQKLSEVTLDELISMGVDGLYDALKNFDPSKKTKFETYAPLRIRGSMLDAIRKADWVPRLVRAKAAFLDKARQSLESEVGRKLSDVEMAEKLHMSVDEYRDMSRSASAPLVHNIQEVNNNEGETTFSIEQIEDADLSTPVDSMIRQELWDKLLGKNFTPQEREIMWLYYKGAHSMKEISKKVELSESRVSQMHTTILRRLEQKVKRNPEYFSDIWEVVERFKEAAENA